MAATPLVNAPLPFSDLTAASGARLVRLSDARRGLTGVVARVTAPDDDHGAIDPAELERRLLEMGFVEGAKLTLLHEGFIGRDPIAVRLDDMRVALRRREARGVWIERGDETKS